MSAVVKRKAICIKNKTEDPSVEYRRPPPSHELERKKLFACREVPGVRLRLMSASDSRQKVCEMSPDFGEGEPQERKNGG